MRRRLQASFMIAGLAAGLAMTLTPTALADTDTDTDDPIVLAREEFDCGRVTNAWTSCGVTSYFSVPNNRQHLVAIRGADGMSVRFQARSLKNEPLGTSTCVRLYDPSKLIWTNRKGHTVNTKIHAQVCQSGESAEVEATQYN